MKAAPTSPPMPPRCACASGNAVLLRGGSEAVHSNRAIHAALVRGLAAAGVPAEAVQLVPTQDRAAVGAMLTAAGLIDMIVPRGGKSLVARVQADARVPVLAHLDGICHTYVHAAPIRKWRGRLRSMPSCAAPASAERWRRCCSTRSFRNRKRWWRRCSMAGCELRGDSRAMALDPRIVPASAMTGTPNTSTRPSVAVVDGLVRAGAHRRAFLAHTDAIVTADEGAAERFLSEVDSAIVMAQRLYPVRRWRRIRPGRGDRHCHRSAARPRPGRAGRAHHLQVAGARNRTGRP
jgi:glutamate-5-semialdehyde dehydrogenase